VSKRAGEFLEQWLIENAPKPLPGAADSEARLLAEESLRAAKEEGLTKEDMEEEVGDLLAYMNSVIAELVARSETTPPELTGDDREQRIRNKAYDIWLDEGRPEGRGEVHWDMASELVAIQENYALTLMPVPDHASSTPTGEPVEPLLAIENAGEFPTLTDQGEESPYPHKRASRKNRRNL